MLWIRYYAAIEAICDLLDMDAYDLDNTTLYEIDKILYKVRHDEL